MIIRGQIKNFENKKEDSLKKRYLYKLGANLIGLPIQLGIQVIIPRSLGPEAYGQFNFLTNTILKIISFVESGTSIAFYTKLSGDLKNTEIIKYYFRFLFLISFLILLFISSIILLNFNDEIWPDQKTKFIFMAFFWGILSLFSNTLNKTIDAYAITIKGELIKIVQKIFALVLILNFYLFWQIDLMCFFIYHYIIMSFLIIGWLIILSKYGINFFKLPSLTRNKVINLTKYFWTYSSPLLSYSLIGMIVGILDLWLLQKNSGSIQQGYFGLSNSIASICFLFTGAMTPLITREFAITFKNRDFSMMRHLFKKYIPLLYTIAAALSVFLAVEASTVTMLFGGEQFHEATLPIALMALYPIHQTYGQLSGSVFYASGQTKLYRNIGVSMMILGVIVSVFLLAPGKYYGLELGALGLAIKMLVMQFLAVNIQLYFNAKLLSLNLKKFVGHQVLVIGIFLFIAIASKASAVIITQNPWVSFILTGTIYTVSCFILLYRFPVLISITRLEMKNYKALIIQKIKQR